MDDGQLGSVVHKTYTERFEEIFPYYLALGMTYEQFWYKDPWLVKYYRQADEIKRQRDNYNNWLQGLYIYQAIGSFVEVLPAFPRKGAKVHPYVDKPYPVTRLEQQYEEEEKRRKKMEQMKARFTQFASQFNRRFEENGKHNSRYHKSTSKVLLNQSGERYKGFSGSVKAIKRRKLKNRDDNKTAGEIKRCD